MSAMIEEEEFDRLEEALRVSHEGPSNDTPVALITVQGMPIQVLMSAKEWHRIKGHAGRKELVTFHDINGFESWLKADAITVVVILPYSVWQQANTQGPRSRILQPVQ